MQELPIRTDNKNLRRNWISMVKQLIDICYITNTDEMRQPVRDQIESILADTRCKLHSTCKEPLLARSPK